MQMFSLEAGGIQMMQLEDAELARISSSLLVLHNEERCPVPHLDLDSFVSYTHYLIVNVYWP
jgi:hypothetical protein